MRCIAHDIIVRILTALRHDRFSHEAAVIVPKMEIGRNIRWVADFLQGQHIRPEGIHKTGIVLREDFAQSQPRIEQEVFLLYASDPEGMRGAGTGTRLQQHYEDMEQIYEPSLDPYSTFYDMVREYNYNVNGIPIENAHISYGYIYGIYYARLLDGLMNGTVPEDMLSIVENYFYNM